MVRAPLHLMPGCLHVFYGTLITCLHHMWYGSMDRKHKTNKGFENRAVTERERQDQLSSNHQVNLNFYLKRCGVSHYLFIRLQHVAFFQITFSVSNGCDKFFIIMRTLRWIFILLFCFNKSWYYKEKENLNGTINWLSYRQINFQSIQQTTQRIFKTYNFLKSLTLQWLADV